MNLAERCASIWPLDWRQHSKHEQTWVAAIEPGHTVLVSEDTSKYYTEYAVSVCSGEGPHQSITNMSSDHLRQLLSRAREHLVANPPRVPELL